eukprot:m.1339330 g.1339330  ORF g.1339330 m.1339330 type:complete len:648 (-) comp24885_c1_seq13:594-2537(-)
MAANRPKDVRILLLGDRGVGKTSIIKALIRNKFVSEVPPRSPDVTVPPEMTLKDATTYIVDSCLRVQDENEIAAEVKKASVVCILYAADDQESREHVSSFWMPFIRQHGSTDSSGGADFPVILVRNKSDLGDPSSQSKSTPGGSGEENTALIAECWDTMEKYKEIVTCVECSAKQMKHVPELFHYSLNSVLYPTTPLYDLDVHSLKEGAVNALGRVFAICDINKDGVLDDDELNQFQTSCFQGSNVLASQELVKVKEVIGENVQGGLLSNKVTPIGFLFLNQLFIERGRPETTWAVLRRFGYDDHLHLDKNYACPQLSQLFADCSTELSDDGVQFLSQLFDAFDKSESGALKPAKILELLNNDTSFPFEQELCVADANNNDVAKNTYLNSWRLGALDHPDDVMRSLAHLGYSSHLRTAMAPAATPSDADADESVQTAIHVTRRRVIDWETRFTARKVFQGWVFSTDTAHTDALMHRNGACDGLVVRGGSASIGQHEMAAAGTRWLKLARIPEAESLIAIQSDDCANKCDVAVFMYSPDDTDAMHSMIELHEALPKPGPRSVFVGVGAAPSGSDVVTKYCKTRRIEAAVMVGTGAAADDLNTVLQHAVAAAMDPCGTTAQQRSWIPYAVGAAAVVAIGCIIYQRMRKQ